MNLCFTMNTVSGKVKYNKYSIQLEIIFVCIVRTNNYGLFLTF